MPAARRFGVAFASACALLCGCATPPEIKTASKNQLKLIESLDEAVTAVDAAIAKFHEERRELIRESGRVRLTRAAIVLAVQGKSTLTLDELAKLSKEQVRRWVDDAFTYKDLQAAVDEVQKRIKGEKDSILKDALEIRLQDLQKKQAAQAGKPSALRTLDESTVTQLENEKAAAANTHRDLQILRTQLSLMKLMAQTADDWLQVDVTVTQKQVDALKDSYARATQALSR